MIDTALQDRVPDELEQRLDPILERMLGMVPSARYRVTDMPDRRQIVIAGTAVSLDPAAPAFELQLERLAAAVEASIAYDRANAMITAADAQNGPVPLWLVTGSSMLTRWLAWSRGESVFRKMLVLSDEVSNAPVVGVFERSKRTALGQAAVKIRVRDGFAVAEKIQILSDRISSMAFGQTARLTMPVNGIPHTVVASMVGRRMSEVIGHSFFTEANPIITDAEIIENSLVINFDHEWGPLAPVPKAAIDAVPADADPACPWRPTRREVVDLYAMVDTLRGHGRTA